MSKTIKQRVKGERRQKSRRPVTARLKPERIQDLMAEEPVQPTAVQSTVLVTELAVASRGPAVVGLSGGQVSVSIAGRRRTRSGPESSVVDFAMKVG